MKVKIYHESYILPIKSMANHPKRPSNKEEPFGLTAVPRIQPLLTLESLPSEPPGAVEAN